MRILAFCLAIALTGCASVTWMRTGEVTTSLASAKAGCVAEPTEGLVDPADRLMELDRCMEQKGWVRPEALPARNEKR